MTYCEDYPCCGHTPDDPCGREWYDEPDAFDVTVNPHAFCDHGDGICEAEPMDEDDEDEDEDEDEDDAEGARFDRVYGDESPLAASTFGFQSDDY